MPLKTRMMIVVTIVIITINNTQHLLSTYYMPDPVVRALLVPSHLMSTTIL